MRPAATAARPSFFDCMFSPSSPACRSLYRIRAICNESFSKDFCPTSAQWTMFLHVRAYVSWILRLCSPAKPVRNTDIPQYYRPLAPSQRRVTGYDLTRQSGDVAQLAEHLLCKQGVVGSNPIVSTEVKLQVRGQFWGRSPLLPGTLNGCSWHIHGTFRPRTCPDRGGFRRSMPDGRRSQEHP
jgi:hypothetical protein